MIQKLRIWAVFILYTCETGASIPESLVFAVLGKISWNEVGDQLFHINTRFRLGQQRQELDIPLRAF